MENNIRLQKYLAQCGVASRRAAETLIAEGKVAVNGKIAEIGAKITPGTDEVRLNGKIVAPPLVEKLVYIALNKPVGVISAVTDQFGRTTVTDLVAGVGVRLFPVGRLDYATSGLILLTNDGDVTFKLTHPKHSVEKTYIAVVRRPLGAADVRAFAEGIAIDGHKTRPVNLEYDGLTAKVILKEGRNRQVRKMFEAIGNEVVMLQRISVGLITLNDLAPGQYRHLVADEINYLKTL